MISGSVISNSVGSLLFYGIRATILFSTLSACTTFVIAGTEAVVGEVSIGSSVIAAYLIWALLRV